AVVIDCTDTGASPPTGTFPTMICRVLRRFASGRGGVSGIPRSTVVTLDSPRLPPKEGGDGFSSVSEWGRTFESFRCRALDRPHSRRPQLHRRVRNASPRLPVLGAGTGVRETRSTPAPRQVN